MSLVRRFPSVFYRCLTSEEKIQTCLATFILFCLLSTQQELMTLAHVMSCSEAVFASTAPVHSVLAPATPTSHPKTVQVIFVPPLRISSKQTYILNRDEQNINKTFIFTPTPIHFHFVFVYRHFGRDRPETEMSQRETKNRI